MKIYTSIQELNIEEDTVCAIGKFDGAHRGHRLIMDTMRRIRDEKCYRMAAFSFSGLNDMIDDEKGRLEKFESEGFDYLALIPFESVKDIEGDAFIKDILVGKMHMKAIVAGTDCSFGHDRSGDAALLEADSAIYGYEVHILEKLRAPSGDEISSTGIRNLLAQGDVRAAAQLLGEYYTIHDVIRKGLHVGTEKLGLPTANIYPQPNMLLPKNGVYATYVFVEGHPHAYAGMTNIGSNPTVNRDSNDHVKKIETHILDFPYEELYGKAVTLSFVTYLRPEIKFASLDGLREQMLKDKKTVGELLSEKLPYISAPQKP